MLPDTEALVMSKALSEDQAPTSEEWLAMCRDAELSIKVPKNVRGHFEAARGALAYGFFYFPLYNLAVEQLHRAAEWAVLQKCKETNRRIIDQKGRQIDFYQGLAYLRNSDHISKEDFHIWEEIRKFRNRLAPPKPSKDPIALPPQVIGKQFKHVAEMISGLFK